MGQRVSERCALKPIGGGLVKTIYMLRSLDPKPSELTMGKLKEG